MKLFKKLFYPKFLVLFFFSLLLSLGIFLKGAEKARAAYIEPTLQDTQAALNANSTNLNQWTAQVATGMANYFSYSFVGPIKPQIVYYQKDGTPVMANVPSGGILGLQINLLSTMFNPPVHTQTYVADLLKTPLTQQAFASPLNAPYPGGAVFLDAVLGIWKVFRNIAYVFFVIIFVAMGFMIMFRIKLDPQTVISVQNSIPSIVIGLILVTLSYAISSLILDIMQLGMTLIFVIMRDNSLVAACFFSNTTCTGVPDQNSLNIFNLLSQVFVAPNISTAGIANGSGLSSVVGSVWTMIDTMLKVVSALGGAAAAPGAPVGSSLVILIVSILMVFTTFRLFFALLTHFIQIIIGTIFSPLIFLFGSLPGKNNLYGEWFMGMLANALAFPAVFFMILLASAISGAPKAWQALGAVKPFTGWQPDLLTGTLTPGAGGAAISPINTIVAFGIILMLPSIPEMIEKALEVKPGAQIDTSQISKAARFIPVIGSFIG